MLTPLMKSARLVSLIDPIAFKMSAVKRVPKQSRFLSFSVFSKTPPSGELDRSVVQI